LKKETVRSGALRQVLKNKTVYTAEELHAAVLPCRGSQSMQYSSVLRLYRFLKWCQSHQPIQTGHLVWTAQGSAVWSCTAVRTLTYIRRL